MELLAEHLACWGCHIAFPELSFLTLSQLRKFMKNTPVDRFRQGRIGVWFGARRHMAMPDVSMWWSLRFFLSLFARICRKAAKQLVEAVEKNVAHVGSARDQVST